MLTKLDLDPDSWNFYFSLLFLAARRSGHIIRMYMNDWVSGWPLLSLQRFTRNLQTPEILVAVAK